MSTSQPSKKMTPPASLTAQARKHFLALAGLLEAEGRASASYVPIAALAAQRIEDVEATTKHIQEYGRVYETKTDRGAGSLLANPPVAQRNDALRHLHPPLAELGLTPASLKKLKEMTNDPAE